MKDKEKKIRRLHFHRTPKSDPSSPAASTSKSSPPGIDFSRVMSSVGGSRKKKSSPPHTPTKLGFDTDSILKPRINRTASVGSTKHRHSGPLDEGGGGGVGATPAGAGTPVGHCASPTGATPAGPLTPKASRASLRDVIAGTSSPFQAPKSKFKMAHESFRLRMFQEQYGFGFEPVFMTKKRTADSKFSEFKGGDLNKYTARSYAIKNGNEVFGDHQSLICGRICRQPDLPLSQDAGDLAGSKAELRDI